jgi:hypothetical protein
MSMHATYLLLFFTTLLAGTAGALQQVYWAEARNEDDVLVYNEKHTVDFDGDRILHSLTEYLSPEGERIAILESDYAMNVSMPTYVFEDLRRGYREGLRRDEEKYVIFRQEQGKKEEAKALSDTSGVFSCQGWHYYLVDNLDVLEKGNLMLRLILPSELKAHTFQIEQTDNEGDRIKAVIKIDNWFLRLFAPRLRLVYDRRIDKLVEYEGLSNIPAPDGGRQDVRIIYTYDGLAPAQSP